MRPHSLILILAIVLAGPAGASAPDTAFGPASVRPGGSAPGGPWDGAVSAPVLQPPERSWSLRTGFRKGILDLSLAEEIAAAPDVAVLRSGFYAEAAALLAEFRESSVTADPDRIAGLAATKPALIIPSGGLTGLASSEFFRAGLAEYVRSGGIALCFSQQQGADLAALPVPPDAKRAVAGAGWAEDQGPLFRASRVQTPHPITAGLAKQLPSVETDGYLAVYPPGSTVLLARPDGRATLVLYPVGRGWVVVTTLFSDYAFGRGALEPDERTLVRGLLSWAKAGGSMAVLAPGRQLAADLTVSGTERGDAAGIKVFVVGDPSERPRDERTIPFAPRSTLTSTLSFTYWIPADTPPGVFHLEYAHTDGKKRMLTPPVEASGGWFAVLPTTYPTGTARPEQTPAALPPAAISASPELRLSGAALKLVLTISKDPGHAGAADLLVRAEGREQRVTVDRSPATAVFDLPAEPAGRTVSYGLHLIGGRTVARGSIPAAAPAGPGVSLDRHWYRPGQKIRLSVNGMGLGAFSGSFLGVEQRQHISRDAAFEFPVPSSLPAGVYALDWEFQTRTGAVRTGRVNVPVAGPTAVCSGLTVTADAGTKNAGAMLAHFTIAATDSIAASARLRLAGPEGTIIVAAERAVALKRGLQEIFIPFSFQPGQSGIWHLLYELTAAPAAASGPVMIASGRVLIDAGDAAVLDVRTDRPIHYESGAEREVLAVIYARSAVRVDLFLDSERPQRRKVDAPGTHTLAWTLERPAPGPHTVRVSLSGSAGDSSRTLRFLNGARLPDLVPVIRTSEPKGAAMEIGVGVMNQGRLPSGHARAMLYEGDPASGGTLVNAAVIPPLEPGKQHVVIIRWQLGGKAGKRTLFAVVATGGAFIETNDANNAVSADLSIPDIMLTLNPRKNAYAADEPAAYTLNVANFTASTLRTVAVSLQASDPSGRVFNPESLTVADLAPGVEKSFERTLRLDAPAQGTYIISAHAAADGMSSSDSLGINILPTLLLKGSLEGTPSRAAPCGTLVVHYAGRDAGNVPLASSRLRLEIRPRPDGEPVFHMDLSVPRKPARTVIDRIAFPRGNYAVQLRGTAVPKDGVPREFLLAEQELTVAGPLVVNRSAAAFPRVLLWAGLEGAAAIDRAIAEKIIHEAFDREDVYLKIVASAEDFAEQAGSGLFTVLLLLDTDGTLDAAPLLRNGLADGTGVILAGANERSVALAEALGFGFGPPPGGKSMSITFPPGSGPGITGSIPVSGRVLAPRKSGAKTVALFPDGDRPAVLIDRQGSGKVMVIPFSLTRSALDTGISGVYALLLRSAVQAVAPEQGGKHGIGAMQIAVSSPTGPVEARITETLPEGAAFIWTSDKGTLRGRSATFEFAASEESRQILYLYRSSGTGRPPASEVQFQCSGSFVLQERIE